MVETVESSAPLDGLIVVSLEQAISAPFATRQLADLGATVIKVERPEGDFARHYDSQVQGLSAFFVWANRGKQSIMLDLKSAEDFATFTALIAGADVFVHNISPGAAARLSIGSATLAAQYPALIACEISGYGAGGPRSDDKAYDLAIQAEAGAFSVTGDEDMSKVGFSIADIASGMYALTSILAALVRRDRTGQGAVISVSMLESLAEWLSAPLYAAVHGSGQAPRTGRRHHSIAPYGTFTASDGHSILIAVQNDREWVKLADVVLGEPELGTDGRFATNSARLANVDALEALLIARLSVLTTAEAFALLREAGIAVASVNTLAEVWEHEQLRARDRFQQVDTETGPLEMLVSPFDISGWRPGPQRVPALDEHDAEAIQRIVDRGAPL